MADECMSPQQYVVAEAMKKAPPQSVFDAQRQRISTLKTQHFLALASG